jgi:23S rRNA (adenine2503-C2)-methyltransferase
MNCPFCATGQAGLTRNLSTGEIVEQVMAAARAVAAGGSGGSGAVPDPTAVPGATSAETAGLGDETEEPADDAPGRVSNVVFMGMGEPLLNVANVSRTLDLLDGEVSPRRTTLSTAGVVPGIRELAKRERRPNLAVSLTAADDDLRTRLMPINAQWPVAELFAALAAWPLEPGRRITFEVVLIAGVNDGPAEARALARLVKRVPSKVNLIPLNESKEWLPGLARPSEAAVDAFGRLLAAAGVDVTVRWSKGLGAAAACGQLKGREAPGRAPRTPRPTVRS